SEIESIWDSQIRAFLIHRAGWAGGQHGWASLTLTIFGSGWLRRSRLAGCPAIGRPNNSGLPSARPLDGCDGDERPAVWRRARWVVTGRRRFPANTAPGCYRGSSGDFTLRGLVVELAERGLKVDYRSVWEFVHAEKLSFKKKRGGWRTRSSRRRPTTSPVDQLSRSRRT